MLSELQLNRSFVAGIFAGCMLAVPVSWLGYPIYKSLVISAFQKEFATLTFKCDQAMREHWISKMAVAEQPTETSILALKAAEISLIDCQDYDLLQKRLRRFGLEEAEIGELVLKAAEQSPEGLRTVIGIHEIRY